MLLRKRDYIWTFIFYAMLVVLVIVIMVLFISLKPTGENEENVGVILISKKDDGGWSESHYDGLKGACDELGRRLIVEENIDENEKSARPAVGRLVDAGCKVIFFTSDGFGNNMTALAEDYPDIVFYTISPEADASNMTTYYGRMYQMRYLCGIIAGKMTETNVLGYVAGRDTAQVDRGINAYLLGARSVNENATVAVKFTNTWLGDKDDRDAAEYLVDNLGADVMTYHSSYSATIDVAEAKGVYSIGYISVKNKEHSDKFLTASIFNWDSLYKGVLQDYIRGNVNTGKYYWWGVSNGVVGLSDYSPLVDDALRETIDEVKESYVDGWDVFVGEIKSTDGEVKCQENERIGDKALLNNMDWFVEGVQIYE